MRRCLILDDEDIEGTISGFKKRLSNNDEVYYKRIDICATNANPDFPKTVECVSRTLKDGGYDVLACDMQLGFEEQEQFGYDIIQEIIKKGQNPSFILYSGNFSELARILALRIQKNGQSPDTTLNALRKIKAFVDRSDNLEDQVLRVLNEDISIYSVVKRNLEKYPDFKLEICFSGFENKTCGEIAKELDSAKHNANVNKFTEDLIERAIDHMIKINQ